MKMKNIKPLILMSFNDKVSIKIRRKNLHEVKTVFNYTLDWVFYYAIDTIHNY